MEPSLRPIRASNKQLTSSTIARTWILVATYGLLGATLALVLAGAIGNLIDRLARAPGFGRGAVVDVVRGRGPGSLSCSYKSFLGWDTAPVRVDVLWAVVGTAAGTALGLMIARLRRRYESPNNQGSESQPVSRNAS